MTKKLHLRILLKPCIVLISVAVMLVVQTLPVMAGMSSVGAGWGAAYGGGPGMNLDFNTIPDVLDLSLGLAWINDEEYVKQIYYTVGGKCYFGPATQNFRFRLSIYYGYTGETEWTYIGDKLTYYHDYMGVMVGCGFVAYFGKTHRHGLELDFPIFILSRDKTPIINSGNLSASLGYKYRIK